MQDYELSILEQYPVTVKSTRKMRGAFFCDTDQGLFLLREAGVSRRRVLLMRHVGLHLLREGGLRTDLPVANRDGEYVTVSPDGRSYILKEWYAGRECDVRRTRELLEGTANLAHLHRFMERVPPCPEPEEPEPEEPGPGEDREAQKERGPVEEPPRRSLGKEYESHNRELRKIRRFIREKPSRGEFELAFLGCFDSMFAWARRAMEELERTDCGELDRKSRQENTMLHGDYNYHNILLTDAGCATTNFDRCRPGVQAEDLYYFLRKAMEKHGWNVRCADHMLDAYSAIRPLSAAETDYLKVRLIYPEKFWKLADAYYRSGKAWIPVKSVEKLRTAVMQTEEKGRFLEQIFRVRM